MRSTIQSWEAVLSSLAIAIIIWRAEAACCEAPSCWGRCPVGFMQYRSRFFRPSGSER